MIVAAIPIAAAAGYLIGREIERVLVAIANRGVQRDIARAKATDMPPRTL